MRLTIPIPLFLACYYHYCVASAQTCDNGGTACGYAAQLCCTANEICMTNENNQALCSVLDSNSVNPTLTLVVSMQPVPVTTIMPTPTQITVLESSSSEAHVGDASGTTVLTSMLSSSTMQGSVASGAEETVSPTSAESTAESDASVAESTASTTNAESTASTGLADASGALASTTTGAGGRVERSCHGVVGVGVVVAMVLMV